MTILNTSTFHLQTQLLQVTPYLILRSDSLNITEGVDYTRRVHQHGIHLNQMGIIYIRFLKPLKNKDKNHVGK